MEDKYLSKLIEVIANSEDIVTFLHNTNDESVAKKIMLEGFEFQSHLDYTTDVVSAKDPVTIKYFSIVRQAYGKFTLVIQISRLLIEEYSGKLKDKEHHFSEVLSTKPSYLGPDEELIFCLAPNFIKGYICITDQEFHANPKFDPSLKLPIFDKNLERILSINKGS